MNKKVIIEICSEFDIDVDTAIAIYNKMVHKLIDTEEPYCITILKDEYIQKLKEITNVHKDNPASPLYQKAAKNLDYFQALYNYVNTLRLDLITVMAVLEKVYQDGRITEERINEVKKLLNR